MSRNSHAAHYEAGKDIEPSIVRMLQGAIQHRELGAYQWATEAELQQSLMTFFNYKGLASPRIENLKRVRGGASKEQFVFDLQVDASTRQKCVLRLDPLESAVVSDRRKEQRIMEIMASVLPVPQVLWSDPDGAILGRPALITSFVRGVTKPSDGGGNVSGLGSLLPDHYRDALSPKFMDYLVKMHAVPVSFAPDGIFDVPSQDDYQAARWQLNWWRSVWRDDAIEGSPIMGLAERWMEENLPKARELVVVHADFRTGNYLFDEDSFEISAILDWELAHIGDYHEDLAWIICHKGVTAQGEVMASGLMTPEALCRKYSELTGRVIDPEALMFYRILSVYKCVAICFATSVQTARRGHSHQDILLSWLASAGHAFSAELLDLMEEVYS